MMATRKPDGIRLCDKMAVDAIELQTLLGCGRAAAIRIATEAGCRIQIGKRVLYSTKKLQEYLDKIAE
jgi:hypothetical protein